MRATLLVCSVALLCAVSCKQGDAPPQEAAAKPPAPKAVAAPAAAPNKAAEAAPIAAALANFEGEIDLTMKSEREPDKARTLTLLVKDGQLRFDVPTGAENAGVHGKPYQIINVAQGKVYSVADQQKMVVEMDAKSLAEQVKNWAPSEAKTDKPKTPPKVTKTGKTDTVAGYKCEEWDVTSEKGTKEKVCVVNEGAGWLKFPFSDLPADQTWAKELFDGSHFPVRFITLDAAGKETNRVEVRKLERKSLSKDLFVIPADYRRMDMNAMMGGMRNLQALSASMKGAPGAGGAGAAGTQGGQIPPAVQEMLRKMKEKSAATKSPH